VICKLILVLILITRLTFFLSFGLYNFCQCITCFLRLVSQVGMRLSHFIIKSLNVAFSALYVHLHVYNINILLLPELFNVQGGTLTQAIAPVNEESCNISLVITCAKC